MAYIGTSPSNGVRRVFDYTATAGQDTFQSTDNNGQSLVYTDSAYIDVYQNGILLLPSDYQATSGITVVLDVAAALEDTVQIVAYDVFSVADTVSASDGGSFAGNVGVGGTLSVTGNVISPITLGGTTPTLTIGDAGAEDAKIVFDGNAQDYHIGLDDSSDSLVIGKGSALGTTTSMVIDADGIITQPLQSAFLAAPSGTQSDLDNTDNVTVVFGNVVYDQNGDFASNTFTAPVTGKYFLSVSLYLGPIDTAASYIQITIDTSNRNYYTLLDPNFVTDIDFYDVNMGVVADMDAGDTAFIRFNQSAGTAQTDINTDARFMGYLLG